MDNFEPSEDPNNYKWGIFYFNSEDHRIIVPKRIKWFGWTLNFAKHETYVMIILFLIMMYLSDKYKTG